MGSTTEIARFLKIFFNLLVLKPLLYLQKVVNTQIPCDLS